MRRLLDTKEAAALIGLSPRTLEKLRSKGGGPEFLKLRRRVLYAERDLESWASKGYARARHRAESSAPGASPVGGR
jgi:hypothetical protein